MCPWVGPHAPSFGRQLWGLSSRVEYLSCNAMQCNGMQCNAPQGMLLPHEVKPPQPCRSSFSAPLLGRRPPPGLCTGSPVTGCFHGSG